MAFVTTTTPDLYATTSNLEEIPAGADPLEYADDAKMNQILVGLTALHGWASGVPVSETANGHFLAMAAGSSAAVSVAAGVRIRQNAGALDYSYNTGAYARLLSKLTLASQATGDIMYASAADTWTRLAAGTNGHVLTLSGGLPVWAAGGGGGGIADSDNVVWTGTHSFEGGSFNVNPLATFVAGITMTTATALVAGANTLISGDKLQVGQLSGAVTAALGGTGQAGGYAVGDILYASGASALSKLAAVAAGQVLASAGAATAPAYTSVPAVSAITVGGVGSSAVFGALASDNKYAQIGGSLVTPSYRGLVGPSGSGTDVAGSIMRLGGGPGTGTALAGDVEIWHSVIGTTGSAVNAPVLSWSFKAPTQSGDETENSHLVPKTTGYQDLGSTALRLKDGWFGGVLYAPRFQHPDDADSYLTWDGSDDIALTLGGTERFKFGATRLSAKFGSGSYPTSYDGVSIGSSDTVVFHALSTSTTLLCGTMAENNAGGQLFSGIWGSSAASDGMTGVALANSAQIRTGQVLQIHTNAASSLYLGTNNIARIQLGTDAEAASTTAVYLSVNGTMFRVSVGATDSESSGFRNLRIPN